MRVVFAFILLIFTLASQAQSPLSGSSPASFPGAVNEFLPIEQAYQLHIAVTDERDLQLNWQLAPGYYLYRGQFKYAVEADGQAIAGQAQFPEGLQRHDEFFGDVEVYYDFVDTRYTLPTTISGDTLAVHIRSQACADAGLCYPPRDQYFAVNRASGNVTPLEVPSPGSAASTQTKTPGGSLAYILLLALIGGALLNLMPCVFPVLSLKALSFASQEPGQRHKESLAYTAGVVISFIAVALVLVALQAAGRAAGWGFQLQSPGFVLALAYLFTVMGLGLSGLFEFGSRWMGAGNALASHDSLMGSFFTGVLATLVASPCTGPFMGTAVGFAATQTPVTSISIFAALGLGMALPLVLLSYIPRLRERMPKPGPWMGIFRQLLAFPLYATALWLLWVAGRQTSIDGMTIALFGMLCLILGLWLWRFTRWHRLPAIIALLCALGLGIYAANTSKSASNDTGRSWSPERVEQLRDRGEAVFVDVTADWCLTCIVNEKTVLERADVQSLFAQYNVHYLVADWTHHDPEISAFLREHGRNGIPFYLYYPAGVESKPVMLPQLLTKAVIADTLNKP